MGTKGEGHWQQEIAGCSGYYQSVRAMHLIEFPDSPDSGCCILVSLLPRQPWRFPAGLLGEIFFAMQLEPARVRVTYRSVVEGHGGGKARFHVSNVSISHNA